jgi:hypothetical protein
MKDDDHPGYRLIRLPNGTWSVHAVDRAETFHPVIGPAAEAKRLYVGQLQLAERAASADHPFVVWDVGLGAAANAIGVLRATRDSAGSLRLISFDHTIEPLRFALRHSQQLDYLAGYEGQARQLLETQATRFIDGRRRFCWELRQGDFPSLIASAYAGKHTRSPEPIPQTPELPPPDAVLFDAYSPAKNPEMWTRSLFQHLYRLLDPGRPCSLATYSRSTIVRVTLLVAGFRVGIGHATGEKEETTVAANDPSLISEPLTRAWLTRARRSTSGEPLREPLYRQNALSQETWERLLDHPQFRG